MIGQRKARRNTHLNDLNCLQVSTVSLWGRPGVLTTHTVPFFPPNKYFISLTSFHLYGILFLHNKRLCHWPLVQWLGFIALIAAELTSIFGWELSPTSSHCGLRPLEISLKAVISWDHISFTKGILAYQKQIRNRKTHAEFQIGHQFP